LKSEDVSSRKRKRGGEEMREGRREIYRYIYIYIMSVGGILERDRNNIQDEGGGKR